MLFAETPDRDACRRRAVADQKDRAADHRASGGVAFDVGRRYAGGLRRGGLTHIHREFRATLTLGLMPDRGTDSRHALAPVGQGAGGMPFIDFRLGGQDYGRPCSGIEQPPSAQGDGDEKKAGKREAT